MLVLGNTFQIVSQDSPTLQVGSIVYLEKYAMGAPIGLLFAITSPGIYQKTLKTSSGLVPVLS